MKTDQLIETERLRLRPHRIDDLGDCAAMWADPVVTRYTVGKPLTEEESWTRLLKYAGHWALMGFGYWVVEEKANGKFIGEVGFSELMREIDPSIKGLPEMGWILGSRAHGKGLATEAAQGALAWGEQHLASTPIVCLINPDNIASIRVANKCGFREYRRSTYKGQAILMFQKYLDNIDPSKIVP